MTEPSLHSHDARPDLSDERLRKRLAELTLEEKVLILTGHDFWATCPIDRIGLRRMVFSDGPSGVRGELWDERSPSINLPSGTALSASWDRDIAYRYGSVAAAEARRKGVDVVLGPTINLHRSPLGGRHFECFSEDPWLTADLAEAYVRGVQDHGVGATPKHYVANDFETDRFTVDVVVSERALRELYLLAFERSVTDAHVWLVMSAYNSINGVTATESDLLETPLSSEWGFDGVVVSDWTAVRSLRSAESSQDLVMPGPGGPWGDALVEAVRSGRIDEALVDRKVLRLLLLAARVGALDGFAPRPPRPDIDGRAFAREAAAEGMVLLRNDDVLPIADGVTRTVAVIGHNAVQARTQGGGSATVLPESVVSPVQGLTAALPAAEVRYARGAIVQDGIVEFPADSMINPVTGGRGAHVRLLDDDGNEIFTEERFSSALVYVGGQAPISAMSTFEFWTQWTPDETGLVSVGCAAIGTARIYLDNELLAERTGEPASSDLGAAFLARPTVTVEVGVVAGQPIDVRIEIEPIRMSEFTSALSVTFGTEPSAADPATLIAEAVEVAADADIAVVVVGTNSKVESEGYDRPNLALPGSQDELVRAVAAANPRTVVVVNAGSPVLMPWRDEVAAILLTWFGGQEYGNALADVITGRREPGGRLPTTWPGSESEVPVVDVTPVDGVVRYDEGIHVGYRAWFRAGVVPAFEFGAGRGYTTWTLGTPTVATGNSIEVAVPVTNTGQRRGKEVVQVYASRPDSAVDRPARWLAGFTTVRADPGETLAAVVTIPHRALAYWDAGWQLELGQYDLFVGTSVCEVAATCSVEIDH